MGYVRKSQRSPSDNPEDFRGQSGLTQKLADGQPRTHSGSNSESFREQASRRRHHRPTNALSPRSSHERALPQSSARFSFVRRSDTIGLVFQLSDVAATV